MNNLIIQIESNAGPSEPPGHRTAAAFALIRSRVLLVCTTLGAIVENEPGSSSLMHLSLRGWTVAFALLEDEDDIVRCFFSATCAELIRAYPSCRTRWFLWVECPPTTCATKVTTALLAAAEEC